jgi:outer membrane protein insertion porin family
VAIRFTLLRDTCFGIAGGFWTQSGSAANLSLSATDRLHLQETIDFKASYGMRVRSLQLGLTIAVPHAKWLQAGFRLRGERFRLDQGRDASILAFSKDTPDAQAFGTGYVLKYVSHNFGGDAFLRFSLRDKFSRVEVSYSYDSTSIKPMTPPTSSYFGELYFLNHVNSQGSNVLSGVSTSKIAATYSRNTVDHPLRPTHGTALTASLAIAGLGGDVNSLEPSIDARWFHPGFRNHVIATRLRGRMLTGYGGRTAPPFARYYMGGEDEIRGFDSWSVGPIAYVPDSTRVPVLNDDGSQRTMKVIVGNTVTTIPVTITVPIYRPVSIGGDTKISANVEYRIPLAKPLTLALFTDTGLNRATFRGQLHLLRTVIDTLNSNFPGAGFPDHPIFQSGSRSLRISSGAELQIVVPKLQAPVRLYWAYNVLACGDPGIVAVSDLPSCGYFKPPSIFDRNYLPNTTTFLNAYALYGSGALYHEPRSMLRIAIGFSF